MSGESAAASHILWGRLRSGLPTPQPLQRKHVMSYLDFLWWVRRRLVTKGKRRASRKKKGFLVAEGNRTRVGLQWMEGKGWKPPVLGHAFYS